MSYSIIIVPNNPQYWGWDGNFPHFGERRMEILKKAFNDQRGIKCLDGISLQIAAHKIARAIEYLSTHYFNDDVEGMVICLGQILSQCVIARKGRFSIWW